MRPAAFEVDEFAEVTDGHGHRHFLGPGAELPEWVAPDQIQTLLAAGHITRFEVI